MLGDLSSSTWSFIALTKPTFRTNITTDQKKLDRLVKSVLKTFLFKVPVFELMACSYKMCCLLKMALQCQPYLGRFRNNEVQCVYVCPPEKLLLAGGVNGLKRMRGKT